MQFKTAFICAVLATAGVSASAATNVTNWGTLGPEGMDARAFTTTPGAIDDVYTFSLGNYSDVPSTANYYTATSLKGVKTVNMEGATLTLYSGAYGDASDKAVGSYSFGTEMTDHTFSGLSAGDYYFEVTGTATGTKGSDYYFNVEADAATPPLSSVPEPENAALLFSGISMIGLLAARRKRAASNQ